MNRETIYSALFTKLSAASGLVTKSRKLKHWADVPAIEQPALYQAQVKETVTRQTGQPSVWRLNLDVYLYANTSDPATSPSQVLNPILDAIVASLEPAIGEVQTLSGLVQYCRINGAIETDEGVLGQQAVVIIPIEILTT